MFLTDSQNMLTNKSKDQGPPMYDAVNKSVSMSPKAAGKNPIIATGYNLLNLIGLFGLESPDCMAS